MSENIKKPEKNRVKQMSGDSYWKRGNKHFEEGEYDKAILDYTKALQLDPTFASTYYIYRGTAYRLNKNIEQAIADYTEALRLDPKFAVILYILRGNAYCEKGDYDKAAADYCRVDDPNGTYNFIQRINDSISRRIEQNYSLEDAIEVDPYTKYGKDGWPISE